MTDASSLESLTASTFTIFVQPNTPGYFTAIAFGSDYSATNKKPLEPFSHVNICPVCFTLPSRDAVTRCCVEHACNSANILQSLA